MVDVYHFFNIHNQRIMIVDVDLGPGVGIRHFPSWQLWDALTGQRLMDWDGELVIAWEGDLDDDE